MSHDAALAARRPADLSETRAELSALARDLALAARAPRTRRAYAADWLAFEAWCATVGSTPLPASGTTVALWIAHRVQQGRKASTIARGLAAVGERHHAAGHPSPLETPEVREVRKGVRRSSVGDLERCAPLLPEHLRKVVGALPLGLRPIRDRALLLLGFAAALRRSELVALDVADLEFVEAGLRVTIRSSKTDQIGEGAVVGVPRSTDEALCPVRAVRRWLDAAAIVSGPLFRPVRRRGEARATRLAGGQVLRVVKTACLLAELDPAPFGAHSLRAGFATAAARAGRPEWAIKRHGRWKSDHVVRGYVRLADVFVANAAEGLL